MERIDATDSKAPRARTRVAGLAALLLLAACGREPAVPPTSRADSASPPATVAQGPRAADSLAAPADTAPPPAAGAAPDTTLTADTAPGADTANLAATPTPAALDSLRVEVRRLSEMLAASTRSTDSVLGLLRRGESVAQPPADTAAAPSTTAAVGAAQGASVLQDAAQTARSYGLRAFWALVVLMLTFLVVNATVYVLNALSERSAERRLFFKRLVPIARIVLWTFAFYFVIRVVFAVDARGLLAATAAVGVAIGFAAQNILKNIFGGLVIVFDQPFQVGDKIQVGESYGEVVSIGLRSTRIVTPDDSQVSVPNGQIVDTQVSSANSGALDCQVVTDLWLPGFVDEAKAKRIAYQAAASSKYVFLKKPIVVLVKDEFKETFLTHLKVKAYVLDARYEFVFQSDVTERARAEFRRHGLLTPMHGARAWVNVAQLNEVDDDASPPADGREDR
jgi:small-conductance mechanosensitive channel